jgi:effector-binding domain-containing protein
MPEITRTTLSSLPYVGIRREVPVSELQPFFAEAFPRVMAWIGEHGLEPASQPMARWHAMDMETHVADVIAGVFLHEAVEGQGGIHCERTEPGEALTCTHVGAYDTMPQTWQAVFAEASRQGCTPGAGWEIYVDDPGSTDPAALRTTITLPIR